ncbi:DUF1707 domain-containing protein [Nocardioides zeae]|uniref:DUF1707 domain-containing protein n=1 Tax=Nocardioides imazamoxiresistens TaxID=3231893 RepID=A0ABU3PV29_9ACTN|nr:DUF1707 domain-containing protein [Nocardioides zeae]MDT9593094.1 DUF1707 domain-containing protein [Nocardioides zeae]
MRARDAERAAVADALGEAYADGQLTAVEHGERTSAALAAVRLSDLRGLLGDLRGEQVERARRLVEPPAPAPRRTAPPPPSRADRDRVLVTRARIAIVATAVAVAGTFAVVNHATGDSGVSWGDVDEVVTEQSAQVVGRDDVSLLAESPDRSETQLDGAGRWALDEESVGRFVAAWSERSPYFTELGLWDDWAQVTVPVAATLPRDEQWHYRGTGPATLFHASQPARNAPVMDLGDLDLKRLWDNVEHALADLDVEDAVLQRISVGLDVIDELPTVDIWVTNAYEETAWLETTLSGRIVEEWPFSG